MAEVLNLNNEVVKMRKEVKKVRVLTIRRLTRHISKLKAKKGTEDAVLKNHKRAQRLLEEIHAMKEIKLDQVTKSALAREINFEIVCKKPNSTARDRAIARLTTHPLLKAKIAHLKAAVKAFKDARHKPARTISSEEHKPEEQLSKQPEETHYSNSSEHTKTFKRDDDQDKIEVKEKPGTDMGKKQICVREKQKSLDSERNCSSDNFTAQGAEHHELLHKSQADKTVSPDGRKCLDDLSRTGVDAENDASKSEESGAEEEESFDDSTEERFYNQSSDSDEGDSNDDFFIGKVRRIKKKGAADISLPTEEKGERMLLKKPKDSQPDTMHDTDTKASYQHAKATKLESVFCSSLCDSNKSKTVKRTIRDYPPRYKATALRKNYPQKQIPSGSDMKHAFERKPLEQPLHPSWEASRKRREQVSQITAFQGKKIKFED